MSTKEQIVAACEKGDLHQLHCVLEETELDVGSEPLGSEGETALHIACAHGHLDIVQYLVNDRGCRVTVATSGAVESIPLVVAWANKHWEVVKFLLSTIQEKGLFAEIGLIPTILTQLQEVAEYGDEALHEACIFGHLEVVEFLTSSQYLMSDTNTVSSHGTTPLQVAWENKHWEVASHLLKATREHFDHVGLSPTATTQLLEVASFKEDAFHVACSQGNLEVVKYLHKSLKCSLTQCNSQGETPLDMARLNGHLNVIHFLLESGVCSAPDMIELHVACLRGDEEKVRILISDITSLSTPDRYGITAVHYATYQPKILYVLVSIAEQRDVLSVLLQKDKRGDTPLHYAASSGCTKSVKILISHLKSVNMQNENGDTPLHLLIQNNYCNPDLVREIVLHESCNPSTVNAQNETPLHIASQNGYLDCAELLLFTGKCTSEDIRVAIEEKFLLHQAVATARHEFVWVLLKVTGCNINQSNSEGETPLHVACKSDFEVFRSLATDSRCDLNAQNKNGFTALHITIASGDLGKCLFLITNKECNPNILCSEGAPLHMMMRENFGQSLIILLRHPKCKPNVKDNKGNSALHLAVREHSILCTTCLLQHDGIDPNIQNHIGNTPLHEAVLRQVPVDVVEALTLHKSCNPSLANNTGMTPLQIAVLFHTLDCIEALILSGKCSRADIRKASEGTLLLHQAVLSNSHQMALTLIKDEEYNINETNSAGETPLHVACRTECSKAILEQLVEDSRCAINAQTPCGNTALHVAISSEQDVSAKVQCILQSEECNPNITNSEGCTPLHLAVKKYHIRTVLILLNHSQCNPNIQDLAGNSPLHISIGEMSLSNFESFLNHKNIDLNIQNKAGNTPLHVAVMGHAPFDVVKALTLHKSCIPSIANNKGMTPLQISVAHGKLDYAQIMVTSGRCSDEDIVKSMDTEGMPLLHKSCNPNIANNEGMTPLQISVAYGKLDFAQFMVTSGRYSNEDVATAMDTEGTPLLHKAVLSQHIPLFMVLLHIPEYNMNVTNVEGETALHVACKTRYNTVILKGLIEDSRCVINAQDQHGNTPLHALCHSGQMCDTRMLHTLLSAPGINLECVNHAGQTPAELATSDYFVLETISKYLEYKDTHLETYLKIFVVGNSGGGKSTLIKAITTEKPKSFINSFRAKHVNPSDVPPHTAGIVPLPFNSKHFGHAVLYDFAGQHEYYSSHAAVMENLVLPSPPLFLLLIDISKPMKEVKEELLYWWMFINNQSKRASSPPHVMLVGTHKDIVRERGGNVWETTKQIADIVKDIPVSFQFDHSKALSLDCRKLVSRGLTALLTQLKLTCQTLRPTANITLHCHILKAFLATHFCTSVACEISKIAEKVNVESDLLPQEPSQLIPLLSTLSDKGYILLLQNHTDLNKSWVVLKPELLLAEVNGSIFAPEGFKKHCKGFDMSTGVVSLSSIRKEFVNYSSEVIIGYLTHLEFCFRIKDQHTLKMITKDATLQLTTQGSEHVEEYYFFPALIQKENPSDVCLPQETIQYECGWFYKCSEPTQQLTTRFLHVLILRLAFSCDPPDEPTQGESVVLLRSCSVWKHGIAWWTNDGVETIVEVGLQCRWVAVMLRCPDTHKVQCAQLRTKVISTVLKTKQDFCPAIGMKEYLIAPSSLQYPFEGKELTLYSMKEIAKVVVAGKDFPKDTGGRNIINISQLLPFEPFFKLGEELIENLFTPDLSREREIPRSDLYKMAEKCHKRQDEFKEVLQPNLTALQRECARPDCTEVDRCVALFQIIQRRGCKSWKDFEQEFSKFSIFCGRHPKDLAQGRNQPHVTEAEEDMVF